MITRETEVCIVGGGPGGVFLSAYLNKNKIPHVLVEAESFPRQKACGDVISIHILNELKRVLPEAHSELVSQLDIHHNKGVRFCPPSNKSFNYIYPDLAHFKGEPSSYGIKREVFDEILLKAVAALPYAEVLQPYRIEDIEFKKESAVAKGKSIEVSCNAVFVASGCKSSLAAKFTGNVADQNHYALGLRAYYKNVDVFDDQLAELYVNKDTYFGGLYIGALGDGLYNVNMVMIKGYIEKRNQGYRKIFTDLIESHPVLKQKFKNAELLGSVEGHPLLLGTRKRKLSYKRALFIGDSAGLIDIVTANGIPQAMKSARIAVETYLKTKKPGAELEEVFSHYDQEIYRRLKGDLAASNFLGKMIGKAGTKTVFLILMRLFFNKRVVSFLFDVGVYGQSPLKSIVTFFKGKKE